MRASRLGIIGLLGAAAVYAARRLGPGLPALGRGDRRDGSGDPTLAERGETSRGDDVWPEVADEFVVDPDRVLAEREQQAERSVHPSADTSELVDAERDELTVPGEPGEDHRRRDQTAGEAAQEIAAAQVRSRRHGSEGFDDE